MKTHSGSVTVEMVLLTPVLMVLILFGVYSGRASESSIQVRHSADQAARVASKVSRARRSPPDKHPWFLAPGCNTAPRDG